jgi:hypothetical protein
VRGQSYRVPLQASSLLDLSVHAKHVSRGGSHAAATRAWEPEPLTA